MVSLIENYEQQYAVLTAEITAEIGKLSRLSNGKFCLYFLAENMIFEMKNKNFPYCFEIVFFLVADQKELTSKINRNLEEIQELVSSMFYVYNLMQCK